MAQNILESDEIVIFADNRESSSDTVFYLMKHECAVRPKQLEVADYLVSEQVAIERKTYSDFIQSIIDGRLFSQIEDMEEHFERPVLIIEGKRETERDIHPNAIRGAISSVALEYEMPIVWSEDESDTASFIFNMAKREQEEKDRAVQIRGKRSKVRGSELQEFIVSGLPNISTKMSRRLLEHFNTVEKIFTATEEELKNVEGIGEKRAKNIREIITKEYE